MLENLYPKLLTTPLMSEESFNIEMVRKYYQDIENLKEKYDEKQRKYKNAYNRLLNASTAVSSVAVVNGVSTIGTAFTVVGLPISASLDVVSTVSATVIDAKEFHKLLTLYLQLMTIVRNIDRKMKVQMEESFQKTIMDEISNLKKALEQK